jgi:uncharacterized membrane protein YphA (DoxX/SURF4 family)
MAEQAAVDQSGASSKGAAVGAAAPTREKTVVTNWQKVLLVVVRLSLAYLFFTQLWWKVPPSFGCPADFAMTTGEIQEGRIRLARTSGLCDWLGIQSFYAANRELRAFEANLDNQGAPEIYLNLSALRQFNGWVVDTIIIPNITWTGWVIWLSELAIVILVGLGLFSRLGGLIALGVSMQLYIGLGGIPNPFEWEWVYLNIVFVSVVVIAMAPGRFFGIDTLLIPFLKKLEANGSPVGRIGLVFTGR